MNIHKHPLQFRAQIEPLRRSRRGRKPDGIPRTTRILGWITFAALLYAGARIWL